MTKDTNDAVSILQYAWEKCGCGWNYIGVRPVNGEGIANWVYPKLILEHAMTHLTCCGRDHNPKVRRATKGRRYDRRTCA
jgi:hypothetical protein